MSRVQVDQIAKTVLYEGYLLYPYRRSAVKNQQRWNFGGVYPEAFSQIQNGTDPCTMQTQCLAVKEGDDHAQVQITVRCLHLIEQTTPDDAPWQEAREESMVVPLSLDETEQDLPIRFSAWRETGENLTRRCEQIEGTLQIRIERLESTLFRITVKVINETPLENVTELSRDEVLLRTMASTHVILEIEQGRFISLLEPGEQWASQAQQCENVGIWPILVGEPGSTGVMLSSPIILYDYPEIAPESVGDFFDATEIDEMLTLRVLTLTGEEKQEMLSTSEQARALLQRTEGLSEEQMLNLHGRLQNVPPTHSGSDHEK